MERNDRSTRSLNRIRRAAALTAGIVTLGLVGPTPGVHAEGDALSRALALEEDAGGADLLVLGVVEDVEIERSSRHVAHIRVEETYHGRLLPKVVVSGDALDPRDPEFEAGTHVVALLAREHRQARSWGSPRRFRAVSGPEGVITLEPHEIASTRRWLGALFGDGQTEQLAAAPCSVRHLAPRGGDRLLARLGIAAADAACAPALP